MTQTGRGRAVIVPGLVDAASFAAAIAHSGLKRSKTKRSFGRNRNRRMRRMHPREPNTTGGIGAVTTDPRKVSSET